MIPLVRSFAHLAIRLLLAIYRNQAFGKIESPELERDAERWLERNKS